MRQQKLHLFGHSICPYVQRVAILMKEKNIQYERTDIELHNKPQWLNKISPLAKVPVLVIDDHIPLFESQVICDYLDEVSPGSLQPKDVLEKSQQRAWIAYADEILSSIAKIIYRDKNRESFDESCSNIFEHLKILEKIISADGCFSATQFYLIDAVYSTVFRYFKVLFTHLNQNPFHGLPKVEKWQQALSERTSIKEAVANDYDQLLVEFIQKQNSYISHLVS